MAIGGRLHTQSVLLGQDNRSYVDMASGEIYLLRDPVSQFPDEGGAWAREVLMHESIVGEPQIVQMALIDAVMRTWFTTGGRKIEVEEGKSAVPPMAATTPLPEGGRVTGSGIVIP